MVVPIHQLLLHWRERPQMGKLMSFFSRNADAHLFLKCQRYGWQVREIRLEVMLQVCIMNHQPRAIVTANGVAQAIRAGSLVNLCLR